MGNAITKIECWYEHEQGYKFFVLYKSKSTFVHAVGRSKHTFLHAIDYNRGEVVYPSNFPSYVSSLGV